MTSEFGKGLVVCLTKFAEHFENRWAEQISSVHTFYYIYKGDKAKLSELDRQIRRDAEDFEAVQLAVHKNVDEALSSLIELWANGATDHLYDIEVPEDWKENEIGKKVAELQKLGLAMGHGFTGKLWKYEDFLNLLKLTREIALMVDLRLGLKNADLGQY
jgi:hypothetical protein